MAADSKVSGAGAHDGRYREEAVTGKYVVPRYSRLEIVSRKHGWFRLRSSDGTEIKIQGTSLDKLFRIVDEDGGSEQDATGTTLPDSIEGSLMEVEIETPRGKQKVKIFSDKPLEEHCKDQDTRASRPPVDMVTCPGCSRRISALALLDYRGERLCPTCHNQRIMGK